MKKYFILSLLIPFFSVSANLAVSKFTDLNDENENKDAIEYVKNKGIVSGYDDGTFKPENKINRAEFLKIAVKSMKGFDEKKANECVEKKKNNGEYYTYLKDVKIDEWYSPFVCIAFEDKIIKGYPDGTFKADNEIGFTEMAKITALTQNLKIKSSKANEEWYAPYIQSLEENNAIPSSIDAIDHKVTRGEMSEITYRILAKIKDKPSKKVNELKVVLDKLDILTNVEPGKMGEIKSCENLEEIMKSAQDYSPNYGILKTRDMDFSRAEEVAVPTTSAVPEAANGKTGGSDDYSKTNIQVTGVDEADIVKNDGKYIYMIKQDTVRIIEAYPYQSMKEVSKIYFDEKGFYPTEMFVNKDKLIVIGNSWRNEVKPMPYELNSKMIMPRYWGSNIALVYVINIKNREKPIVERKISYEGNYAKSRMINDVVYLIVNKYPDYFILRDYKLGAEEIIPHIEDSRTESGKSITTVKCSDVEFFPGYEHPNFMVVSAISLKDDSKEIAKKVLLGSSENIYMSLDSLYVATGARDVNSIYWNYNSTQVYKFRINKENISFQGSQRVLGRVLNQFSMDEYKGNFRIATTKDNFVNAGNVTENMLFVLDKDMKQVGEIRDIANGEKIYSARFMGDRAFLVTFQTMDPFFVIDMKDPKNPKILGELKIPGWSDYLHPYDENHIIGFGKEVDTEAVLKKGRLTYEDTLGMKISMFDITDLNNPKEMFKKVIGDRGTESDLLNDHKALLFDKEKNLLAFPIKITGKKEEKKESCYDYRYSTCPASCMQRCTPSNCSSDGVCTQDCEGPGSCVFKGYNDSIKTTFAGAIVLNIDLNNGISERGRMSNYTEKEYSDKGDYFYEDYSKKISRIIYIGDNLYTISPDFIRSATLKDVIEKNGIQVE